MQQQPRHCPAPRGDTSGTTDECSNGPSPAVWGLPQAGVLANKHLRRKLALFGYHECVNTPGLWRHETRAISFTLVVDDFGVKYVKKDDVDHLIASIK